MNKSILNYVVERVGERVPRSHPGFGIEKMGGKVGSRTAITLCKRRGKKVCAWIYIGGDRSTSLVALIYWTRQDDFLAGLQELSDEDASDARGWMQLSDEALVGDDLPFDGRRLFMLGEPPLALQEEALARWQRTEICAKSNAIFAQRLRKKNPAISDLEIETMQLDADRVTFKLWESIERVMRLDDEQLEAVTNELLNKMFYLLDRYAGPFLEAKLAGGNEHSSGADVY